MAYASRKIVALKLLPCFKEKVSLQAGILVKMAIFRTFSVHVLSPTLSETFYTS